MCIGNNDTKHFTTPPPSNVPKSEIMSTCRLDKLLLLNALTEKFTKLDIAAISDKLED